MISWEIINHHGFGVDDQGVDMGGYSKVGLRLQIIYVRGVVKICLFRKFYLVIDRQAFFNPNSEEALLA